MNERKNIDKNLFNKKSLYLLNIHELRDIGRSFGIPSPTTLDKSKLVEYILKIAYGEIEPPTRNNFGRPSVNKFDIESCAIKIKQNSNHSDDLIKIRLDDIQIPSLSMPKEKHYEPTIYQSICHVKNGNYYLIKEGINLPNDILNINSETAKCLKLEELDVVEFVYFDKFYKIISVNGIKISNKIKHINIGVDNINFGETKTFHFDYDDEIESAINSIIEKYSNTTKILIFSENDYKGENVINLLFDSLADDAHIYKRLVEFLIICEDELKKDNDIIIIIENKNAIQDAIENFEEDVCHRIKTNLLHFVSINKNLGNFIIMFALDRELTYK